MKKHMIIACLSLGMSLACTAQKPLSKIDDGLVKSNINSYKLDKSNSSFISVENSSNKLSNTKPIAPNWPANVSSFKKITIDQKLLTLICAEGLPIEKVKNLPTGPIDALAIRIRADISGKPLEISFLTEKKSILTVNELEKIELEIKKRIIINIAPDFKRYLVGANFIVFDTQVFYNEILLAKRNK